MKQKLTVLVALCASLPALAEVASGPYAGLMLGGANMSTTRDLKGFRDIAGEKNELFSMPNEKISPWGFAGGFFAGYTFGFGSFFVAPEGYAVFSQSIKTTTNKDHGIPSTLSQKPFRAGFVVNAGVEVTEGLALSGKLGVEVGRFTLFNKLLQDDQMKDSKTKREYAFIKVAPVIGGGISQSLGPVTVGLNAQIAFYGGINNTHKEEAKSALDRTLESKTKTIFVPQVALRVSYNF